MSEYTSNIDKIKHLVFTLNNYRNSYYNNSESTISDYEYDKLFDELKELEESTNFIMSNSPTQTVGYDVLSSFEKVTHEVPLLSLDKTQSIEAFVEFCSKNEVMLMHKLDGLTIQLIYENGKLIQASTRGNGVVGEDVTNNVKCFDNVPITIPDTRRLIFTGEAIIDYNTFNDINDSLDDAHKYKNPRNLASGSVKQLDSNICKSRHVKFICWNANDLSTDGRMCTGLNKANTYGFDTVTNLIPLIPTVESVQYVIDKLKRYAEVYTLPIDGIVAMYNDIEYGKSLGKTAHHFNNGYAFKFYDEAELTTLRDIEWSMGKTGELCPVAIFDTVEIDGTEVSRASLHNISIIENLKLGIGDTIEVYKANQIIPQIRYSHTKSNTFTIPGICPVCGGNTKININYNNHKEVKTLICNNDDCKGKLLGKLTHFVSKPCMNIDGLSESTISRFMLEGYINKLEDIYSLSKFKMLMQNLDGFGKQSVDKILTAIENSKTVEIPNFINSLSIPSVGSETAKLLSEYINYDINNISKLYTSDLCTIKGIGEETAKAIREWFTEEHIELVNHLISLFTFKTKQTNTNPNQVLLGLNFVITGTVKHYKNRNELQDAILYNGGTLQSKVSSTTNYLINNDINSNSSKNKAAKELNVKIITESDFLNLIKDNDVSERIKAINSEETTAKPIKKTRSNSLF